MKKIINKYSVILILLIISLWAIKSLFVPGFFTIHDDEQIARLYQLNKILSDGQLPPRWVPDLGFGYGYPLFNFYPPLIYYIGYIFHILGFSFINSTKLVIILGFILAEIFIYLWISNRYGKTAGIIAAIAYTYAPYHAVDLYVRGALSEFFSFVWIPGVFWSLDVLAKNKKFSWAIISGILLNLVILTHLIVFVQFLPFLFIYILFLLYQERKHFYKIVRLLSILGLMSLGLSAYFWIPSYFEKTYTLVDTILTRELANFNLHFVCIRQLWNSPWGYGGSIAGCSDGLSLQIGKLQILFSLMSFIIILWNIIKKKKNSSFIILIFFLLLLSAFLTTKYSFFIWNIFQPFSYIQFPWRFLLFCALFSSALTGLVFSFIQKNFPKKITITLTIVFFLISLSLTANDFHPQKFLNVKDEYYTSNDDIRWRVSNMSYEYVPKQVKTKISQLGTTQLAIDKKDIPKDFYAVKNGKMNITPIKNLSWKKELDVQVYSRGLLQINTFAFPGWAVKINNSAIKFDTLNPLYLITIPLEPGKYKIQIIFKNTPLRTFANGITSITLIILIAYAGVFLYKKHQR